MRKAIIPTGGGPKMAADKAAEVVLGTTGPGTTIYTGPFKDYGAWNSRNLMTITNNQAGNIVIDSDKGDMDVYVENWRYFGAIHQEANALTWSRNDLGYPLTYPFHPPAARVAVSDRVAVGSGGLVH